jgi:actin-related protein
VAGGNAAIPGMKARIQQELEQLKPQDNIVRVTELHAPE